MEEFTLDELHLLKSDAETTREGYEERLWAKDTPDADKGWMEGRVALYLKLEVTIMDELAKRCGGQG